jgi:Mrp family chromosome partitioning ATPase
MPPGTGDVPLTVFQSLPVDGIVIVASPQELVGMIVEKAVKMANLMNIPIIALAENMSYFVCNDCGKKHYIFGESHIKEVAKAHNVDTVSQIPINNKLAAAVDAGAVELFEGDWVDNIADKLVELL